MYQNKRSVLLARTRPQASLLADRLRDRMFQVIECPKPEAMRLESYDTFDQVVTHLQDFELILFGCSASVRYTMERLKAIGVDHLAFSSKLVVATDFLTRRELAKWRLKSDLTTLGSCVEEVSRWGEFFHQRRLLLFTHQGGRPGLEALLRTYCRSVTLVSTYWVSCVTQYLSVIPSVVIYPSSRSVTYLYENCEGIDLTSIPSIAMGPLTARAADKKGIKKIMMPETDTIEDLAALVENFCMSD